MAVEKACKQCNAIYEGDKCPICGSQEYSEEIKGRLYIFDAENSEVAKNAGILKKGKYAIKSK